MEERGNEGISYKGIKIRVGDVVVFHTLDREDLVVHRVLSIDSDAIKTRGDKNNAPDPWVLEPEDIIGRITRVKRKNRTQKIYGGLPGRLYVSGVRAINQVDLMVIRIIHPAYRWLAESGIFRKFLPQQMKPVVIYFKGSNFTELQLLVGRLLPGKDQWLIRRPFRLFIDEHTVHKASDIDPQ